MSATRRGTAQTAGSAGSAPAKVKRSWLRASPPPSRRTDTNGYPPWKIQLSMMRRTGSPVASSMASHRSVVSALPNWRELR